jgi:hypothetical protein
MRSRTTLFAGLPVGLVLGGVLLGGCGGSPAANGIASKPPAQILAAAKAAADGAATVHIAGSILAKGKPLSIDMELLRERGGHGRIAVEGLSIGLIRVDRIVYIGGSAAFYRHVAGAAAAKLLQGKWLKAPASAGNFAAFASLTNLGRLLDSTLAGHGKLGQAQRTTIDGQKAVAVNDISEGGTFYVAATGSPYPIEVVKHGSGGGRIVFDRWNKAVVLAAPSNAININALRSHP